jgi:hypothetical protein
MKKIIIYFAPPNARSSNGRTSDFDSDCIGSNPVRATRKKPRNLRGFFYDENKPKLALSWFEE